MLKGAASAVVWLFDKQRVVNISSMCLLWLKEMCPVDQETPGAGRGTLQLAEMEAGRGTGQVLVACPQAMLF